METRTGLAFHDRNHVSDAETIARRLRLSFLEPVDAEAETRAQKGGSPAMDQVTETGDRERILQTAPHLITTQIIQEKQKTHLHQMTVYSFLNHHPG
jgi:hypothetical protein